ncbi:hypothetical protein HU200_052623 [Digitaria exilis]|uniref:Uncharacterized protein n=1 Tax=Digitaria exilis TaxID=1010633 RepID=A0A835AYM5_9POAL|nr:hypothetical protein HU200_052623 [Digitaria exilis]
MERSDLASFTATRIGSSESFHLLPLTKPILSRARRLYKSPRANQHIRPRGSS